MCPEAREIFAQQTYIPLSEFGIYASSSLLSYLGYVPAKTVTVPQVLYNSYLNTWELG